MLDSLKIPQIKQLFVVSIVLLLVVDQCVLASNQQWANSVGLWGKRSVGPAKVNGPNPASQYIPSQQQTDNMYNFMAKRTAQWQAANGLWGKRSDPQMQQQFYYPAAFQQYPPQF